MNKVTEAGKPARNASEGYIYVLELADGAVKVGQTRNPTSRLKHHAKEAERFGSAVLRSWVSPLHSEYEANERHLIDWCARSATRRRGRETFEGLAVEDVIRYAESLPMDRSPKGEALKREAEAETFAQGMLALLQGARRLGQAESLRAPYNRDVDRELDEILATSGSALKALLDAAWAVERDARLGVPAQEMNISIYMLSRARRNLEAEMMADCLGVPVSPELREQSTLKSEAEWAREADALEANLSASV